MAKIVLNESAPADLNGVSLANAELDTFPFETTDPTVVANASAHPWLDVEVEQAEEVAYERPSALAPEDDRLSGEHESARSVNDPDAVREVEEAKAESYSPVAVESGKDQGDEEFAGPIAVTTAAADVQEPVVEAPAPVETAPAGDYHYGENS